MLRYLAATSCLIVSVVPFVGCATSRAQDSGSTPAQETAHPTTTAAAPVPIVYNKRLNPLPLTDAQVADVVHKAALRCPDARRIWFIYVRANSKTNGGMDGVANVYFTPDRQTTRLRVGRYVTVGWLPPALKSRVRSLREVLEPDEEHPDLPPVQDYWQVSLAAEPFSERLDTPAGTLLPFESPAGFSEAEVVEIVDFARSQKGGWFTSGSNPMTVRMSFDGCAPILSISRSDGLIQVRTGTHEGPLSGAGEVLECRKAQTGFEIVRVFMWVS